MGLWATLQLALALLLAAALGGCGLDVPTRGSSPGKPDPSRVMQLVDGGPAPSRDGGVPPPKLDTSKPAPKTDAAAKKDQGTPPLKQDSGTGGVTLTATEKDLVDAINAARAKLGLGPLAVDAQLMCAARKHASDVGGNGSCGHVGSDGSWPWDRAAACGFASSQTVNEIAAGPGFTDGADAVWGWSQSPGHWAGLTHAQAKRIGVGVVNSCYIAVFDCCVASM